MSEEELILITSLPSELIELILSQDCLAITDICRTAQTCQKIHSVAQSNKLWKRKLKSRWPHFVDKYPQGASHWWQDIYKYRYSCQRRIQGMVGELSALHFNSDEISKDGFSGFCSHMEESDHSQLAVIDELMEIFRQNNSHQKLTIKYYAEKVLRYLQQLRLRKAFTEFLEQPDENQLIEKGAVLIAQWCQPTLDILESSVCGRLDAIAAKVLVRLSCKHPKHPVLCAELSSCKPLPESQWKSEQCRQVLEAMNLVLYTEMGFSGNSEDYYSPDNSYINKVLKLRSGIPISLAIVYSAVARRLGVLCLPVNFPTHFLLKWKEHPTLSSDQMYTYIDAFRSGKFISQNECTSALGIPRSAVQDTQVFSHTKPAKVYERMARNLVHIGRQHSQSGNNLLCLRNALELYLIISPEDLEKRLLLARVNLHLNINLNEVVESLLNFSNIERSQEGLVADMITAAREQLREQPPSNRSTEITRKVRIKDSEVMYSVGMVMKHRRYDYLCVIYGWDEKCLASPVWMTQMGVHNLPHQDNQPFYNVLVTDGSNRYAAHESLCLASEPIEIDHPEVGKHFQEFRHTYYLPNTEKMTQYPEDLEITRTKCDRFYSL